MRTRFLLVIGAGAVAGALAGCGEDVTTAAPAPVKKAAAVADAGVPTAGGSPYVYSYSAIGKRDPFRSQFGEAAGSGKAEGESVVCDEPLCQYDVDELNLVAVVSGDANPLAMVEDKSGIGHLVRRNSKIGRQGGKVTSILRDCIVVTSFVQGPDGKAQPNRSNLCVKKELAAQPVLDLLQGRARE